MFSELSRAIFSSKPARYIQIAIRLKSASQRVHRVERAFTECGRGDVYVSVRMSGRLEPSTQKTLKVDLELMKGDSAMRVYLSGELVESEWEADWAESV
jgi:hypothetical protein